MVNYAKPGMTGKDIENWCNIRSLHDSIRNARYHEERTGETPTRPYVDRYLWVAKRYTPRHEDEKAHVRLMAHVHRWDAALTAQQPQGPDRQQQAPAG